MSFFKIKNERASLLLEALIAMLILSVGLVVIVRSHLAALRSQVVTQDYALASLLLENEMTLLIENGYLENNIHTKKSLPAPYERFELSLATRPAGSGYNLENLTEADMELIWRAGQKTQKLSASTFVFHNP